MKFDVIVGNPPYQLSDGGGVGTSATPIYHKFIQQAKKMNPRYLTMIVPSRWFSGGKGLDEFRDEMLKDKKITTLVDYFDSTECFPGVDISGGINFFLWERDRQDDCQVISIRNGERSIMKRSLLEENEDTFVRFNEAISIIRKIKIKSFEGFENIVSTRRPFGFNSVVNLSKKEFENSVKIFSYPDDGFINKEKISKNKDWVNKYKVFIAKAYGERGKFPYLVLAKPFVAGENTCCSETYLVIGPFNSKTEANNANSYIRTRLFRFLVLLKKNTQNAPKGVYTFVPMQDFSEPWTDKKLYAKYGITAEEQAFIESMIRPMEVENES